jgi:hypothetical protein
MKYLLILFTVFCSQLFAKTTTISGSDFYQAGLTPMAPYVFIYNREAKLIYHHQGFEQTFARAIKQNIASDKTTEITNKLAKIITLPAFEQVDFTLIYTVLEADCPPCDKQIALFEQILPKLAPNTFQQLTIKLN